MLGMKELWSQRLGNPQARIDRAVDGKPDIDRLLHLDGVVAAGPPSVTPPLATDLACLRGSQHLSAVVKATVPSESRLHVQDDNIDGLSGRGSTYPDLFVVHVRIPKINVALRACAPAVWQSPKLIKLACFHAALGCRYQAEVFGCFGFLGFFGSRPLLSRLPIRLSFPEVLID
jgi:hypothetical protein